MSESRQPISDDELDAWLDGQVDDDTGSALAARLGDDPNLAARVALQREIDASLGRIFPIGALSDEHLTAVLAAHRARGKTRAFGLHDATDDPHQRRRRLMRAALVGIAAALAWLTVSLFWRESRRLEPYFETRPVAQLYREAIAQGYEPYYECREEDRFADTFARRQSRPLRLAPLPLDSGMLGLSYPGGMSRDTTAMLCTVEGQPVMVFVDQAQDDNPRASENDDPALNVFRDQRLGLVFYEVTPFDGPRVMQYLVAPETE